MRILEFILASILIELTPGPNMSYLAMIAITRGRKVAVRAVAGVALGIGMIGCLTAFGFSEFLERYPVIKTVIGWGGVIFMIGLAVEAWHNAGRKKSSPSSEGFESFRRGLITNLLNPKLILFFLTVPPGFINKEAGNAFAESFALVAIYTTVATVVHFGIICIASQARSAEFVASNQKMFGRFMALMLLVVAMWLWFDMH